MRPDFTKRRHEGCSCSSIWGEDLSAVPTIPIPFTRLSDSKITTLAGASDFQNALTLRNGLMRLWRHSWPSHGEHPREQSLDKHDLFGHAGDGTSECHDPLQLKKGNVINAHHQCPSYLCGPSVERRARVVKVFFSVLHSKSSSLLAP